VESTPLDLAIQQKKTETADLLRKHGGMTGAELDALLPLLTTELTFTAVSEVPTVYAMAQGSGTCNSADISGSFVILYGSKFNLRIVEKSDYSSVFKADTQLEGNLNGVMTVALNEDLFSTSFSITDELMAVPYVNGKWDTTKAVPVTRYKNLSFDASKKTKAAQWQSAE